MDVYNSRKMYETSFREFFRLRQNPIVVLKLYYDTIDEIIEEYERRRENREINEMNNLIRSYTKLTESFQSFSGSNAEFMRYYNPIYVREIINESRREIQDLILEVEQMLAYEEEEQLPDVFYNVIEEEQIQERERRNRCIIF